MSIIKSIADYHDELIALRRDIHAHPETAFEEVRTSEIVATKLAEYGIEAHRGLGKTGVVGTISNGDGPIIGIRADMDALPIHEKNDFDYKSTNEGKMHACGHDGHTTMLLGAARYLAGNRNFKGTVHLIFQPAEENEGGGRAMVEDGLYDLFPMESVYGMHNQPGMPVGQFAVKAGTMLSAYDIFEIKVTGKGSHAAMPQLGIDTVVVAANIVTALQTIASRNTHPQETTVVSVTQIHGGDTWNVIPDDVVIRGTARTFKPELQVKVEPAIRRIAEGVAKTYGAAVDVTYESRYPPTINTEAEAALCAEVVMELVGAENVDLNPLPSTGSEDFSFILQESKGCYLFIGNGPGEGGCFLHNPHYDFNDEIMPLGASYWVRLVERLLPA